MNLSKTDTKLLTEAAGRSGIFEVPESLKPSTRERILGRLLRDKLVESEEAGHRLTAAGYRAVGSEPPLAAELDAAGGTKSSAGAPRVTKLALVTELLGGPDGASLAELTGATGWLPHTTRAALSRLRSGGQELLKSTRQDGTTAYRIAREASAAPKRPGRRRTAEAAQAAAV